MTVTAAYFGEHLATTVLAASDLSAKQFFLVTVGSTGASLVATQGQAGAKVLVNAPKSGDPAFLWDIGETKVVAGGAFSVGDLLMADSSGRVIKYAAGSGNTAIGEARIAGVTTGDIVTAFMFPSAPIVDFQAPAAQAGLTALAGGGRTGATALIVGLNEVATVATAADSAVLPASYAGAIVILENAAGANSLQVFAAGSDTINGTAGATGVAQAAGKSANYFCPVAGKWYRILSA